MYVLISGFLLFFRAALSFEKNSKNDHLTFEANSMASQNCSFFIFFAHTLRAMEVTDRVFEIGFSATRNQLKNGKLTKLFLILFAKYLAYLMIFQSSAVPNLRQTPLWKIIINMAKNEEKSCSTWLKLISPLHCWYPKPGFWVPVPSPPLWGHTKCTLSASHLGSTGPTVH